MMWGTRERFYWARKEKEAEGIVVVFAWISWEKKHLDQHVRLYGSLGWNSLVCHDDFLTLYFPEKSSSSALGVVEELVTEIKISPSPIVFAAFSGGSTASMYKVLEIIDDKSGSKFNGDDCRLVRDSFCGQIYDSSPVNFINGSGTPFVNSTVQAQPRRAVSWMVRALTSCLDTLFPNKFQERRAEYWKSLLSSVSCGPFLIFYSEDDKLAPCSVIFNFAQRLQELGGDVKLIKWIISPHLGHYKLYPSDYKAAVTELLGKAIGLYQGRIKQPNENGMASLCNQIPESVCNIHEVARNSRTQKGVSGIPGDHFFLPSSLHYPDGEDRNPAKEQQKGGLFDSENPPGIDAHGVLGKILFDACVPKNIEGWDIKPTSLKQRLTVNSRHGRFHPVKLLRRSKL